MNRWTSALALISSLAAPCLAAPALAQEQASALMLVSAAIPAPADTPWPGGAMALDIDATDVGRGAYRVRQTIPLAPGTRRVTLLYPEWLPGHHAPRGPIAQLADLRFSAGGKPASWKRDPLDIFAFHVDIPDGARELVASFVHTSPLQSSEGRVTMTREMLNLQWEKMSLYPAGHFVRAIRVRPTVALPAGWQAATALDGQRVSGNRLTWDETDYETLVDSPIFAGLHFRRWDLGNTVNLNVVADAPELIALRDRDLASLKAMAEEAQAIFGRAPYDRYEFLVALSDRIGGIGLEHLRSSENQLEPLNFAAWNSHDWDRNVLAHELVHSWNGKFRRPEGIWTPDYRQPMQGNLLWVYEGQTQFWGWVLAARSGLQTKQTVLDMIASRAGQLAEQPGRAWRSVEDTAFDPIVAARRPRPYNSLARSEDYYGEGALVWLEADQIIRAGTGGARGLDDFARAFFAHPGGAARVATYGRADVVAALNAIHAHDWDGFLRGRMENPGQPPPLAGIERGGYRLAWKEEPNAYDKARMDHDRLLDLSHSLGVALDERGSVEAVRWGSAAFNAGIVTGAVIVAIDGQAYSAELIKRALARAKGGTRPLELLVRRGDRYLTVPVAYHGGLRWPWLERTAPSGEAPLDRLLSPRRNPMERD